MNLSQDEDTISAYWYYFEDGNQKGPVTEAELTTLFESGDLTATTLVWRKGLDEWVEAKKVKVFSSSLRKSRRHFGRDNKANDATQAKPWLSFLRAKKSALQKLMAFFLIIIAVVSALYAYQAYNERQADFRKIYNNFVIWGKSKNDEAKISSGISNLRQAYAKYLLATGKSPQKIEDLVPLYLKNLPDANGGSWEYNPQTRNFWHSKDGAAGQDVRTYPIKDGWKNAGLYKAGTDIPAGEYLLISNRGVAYYSLMRNQAFGLDNIITNDTFLGSRYITIEDGRYFLLVDAQMIDVKKGPVLQPVNGKYIEGMYKIGRDIPGGKYKIIPENRNDPILEITSNSSGLTKAIITSSHVTDERDITVTDGQYIKLVGCSLKVAMAGTMQLPQTGP
jgi:hypothetical protein